MKQQERMRSYDDWFSYLKRLASSLGTVPGQMEHHGAPRVFPCTVASRVVCQEPGGVLVMRHDVRNSNLHETTAEHSRGCERLLGVSLGLRVDNSSLVAMLGVKERTP